MWIKSTFVCVAALVSLNSFAWAQQEVTEPTVDPSEALHQQQDDVVAQDDRQSVGATSHEASVDTKDSDADVDNSSLHIRPVAELQVTYTMLNQAKVEDIVSYPGGPARERGFALRDLAFGAEGEWGEHIYYEVAAGADASNDGTLAFGAEDAYVGGRYEVAGAWTVGHSIRAGAMKVPFSRQAVNSRYKLQLINRATVVHEIDIRRDIGVAVDGAYSNSSGSVGVYATAGAFNGVGHQVYAADDNNKPMLAGRLVVQLLSQRSTQEGDNRSSAEREELHIAIGGSGLYNPALAQTQRGFGAELAVHGYGASLQGEYIKFSATSEFASVAAPIVNLGDYGQTGYYVQGGYYVLPQTLEIAARFGEFQRTFPSDVLLAQTMRQIEGGAAYHFADSHGLKLLLNYIHRMEVSGLEDLRNDTLTLQLSAKLAE